MSKCAWSYDASVEFHIVVELVAWYIYIQLLPGVLKLIAQWFHISCCWKVMVSWYPLKSPMSSHLSLECRKIPQLYHLSFSSLHFGHVICMQKRGYLWLLGQLCWDLSAHYSCDRWAPCRCKAILPDKYTNLSSRRTIELHVIVEPACLQFPVLRKRHGHWFCIVKFPSLL